MVRIITIVGINGISVVPPLTSNALRILIARSIALVILCMIFTSANFWLAEFEPADHHPWWFNLITRSLQ